MTILDQELIESWQQEFQETTGIPLLFQEDFNLKQSVTLRFNFLDSGIKDSCDQENNKIKVFLSLVLTASDSLINPAGQKIYFMGIEAISFFTQKYGLKSSVKTSFDSLDSQNPNVISQDFGFTLKELFLVDLGKEENDNDY